MITPQIAAREILRRRRSRESLASFADYIDIPGTPISDDEEEDQFSIECGSLAKHHVMICDTFQGLIEETLEYEGEQVRGAMFFMPPGGAKSTYGTVVAPTWAMGKIPGYNIIAASYNSKLAFKQSRKSRQIVSSHKYKMVFDTSLRHDNKAVEDWSLDNQSTYMAGGILSGLTGNRANGLVIDDPIRGRQDAESDTVRDSTAEAIEDDALTRLKPNGWVVYILTRWHEDDPVGRLLPEDWDGKTGFVRCKDGLLYYVLSISAQCEEKNDPLGREIGEYFWPEWFPVTHWTRYKANPRTWASLYQQKPSPDDGDYYKRGYFHRYHPSDLPERLNYYATSDFAVTEPEGSNDPDFTEHTIWGVDCNGDSWLIDNWFKQTSADEWIDSLLDLQKQYKTLRWFGEGGVIRRAVEPFLNKEIKRRRIYPRMEWINPVREKVVASRSFQGIAAQGIVHIPFGPDGDRMVEQLMKFPSVKHDDFCDTCSLWGRALEDTRKVILPEIINRDKVNRYNFPDDESGSNDWMCK